MNQLFPYANIVAGVLLLLVGFTFHWIGQLVSVLNWDFAARLGLQEKDAPPEYKVYEHGIAMADVAIGWVYGVAGVGLIIGAQWGFKLAWIPGAILIYHAIGAWFWTANQNKSGHHLMPDPIRILWCLSNMLTGALAILVAWHAS